MTRKSKYDCILKCLLCIYLYKYLVYWALAFPIMESIFTCVHRSVLSEHIGVKRVWYLCLDCSEQFKRSCSITFLYTYFPDITCNSSWYLCCEEAVLIVLLVHLKWQAWHVFWTLTNPAQWVSSPSLKEQCLLFCNIVGNVHFRLLVTGYILKIKGLHASLSWKPWKCNSFLWRISGSNVAVLCSEIVFLSQSWSESASRIYPLRWMSLIPARF